LPEANDFLVLKPGETVTHLAELSGVYDFAKTGEYSVQFAVESLSLFDPAAAHRQNMRDASGYLQSHNTGGSRYTTWFGVYNSARYGTVKTHFTAIVDAMTNAPITVDCKCSNSAYAYVYPAQPYKIYVCRAFWNAPLNGTDSKAGTLVHEMSHFNVVAGTDDVVYGQTGAKNLALSDPAKAITNADSHEYFAENTPAQP